VRAAEPTHEQSPEPSDPDALVAAWPLVGRDALVARLRTAVDERRRGAVLTGPPGVGKSAVARAVVVAAGRDGAATEWVSASEATREIPLGAFAPLLPKDTQPTTPLDLLRRTTAALHARARRTSLVLAIDDAHLLDPASATLVHQLAAAGEVFVLATVRTGEVAPDSVTALWKDGLAERIDVATLTEDDVAELLRAALDGEVEVATTRRLWSATGGNALFVHELVLAGVRSGALQRHDGVWRWRGSLAGDGGLRAVIDARLAPLSESHRAALRLLAVGEPLGIDVFERLVGITVVDQLERQELVRIRRDDRREEASLAHPLYRDVLLAATDADALAAAQEALAQAVEAAGGRRRGDQLRIALWRLAGPELAQPPLLLAAAAEAESRFDAALAERLARLAIERGAGAAGWHVVASALRAQGMSTEADEAWRTALELEHDPAARVGIAQSRSANLFFGLGDVRGAVAALDAVYADATTQELRDTLASLVAMFDLYRGRIDTALAAAVPILDRGGVKPDARIDAALTASAGYALRGRPADAIAVVDANLAAALQDPAVGSIAAGALMASRLIALTVDGKLHDALSAATVVYDLAVEMGTHDGIAGLSFAAGFVHHLLGDVDAARRHLAEGAVLLREHDRNGYLPWCLGELAYALLLAGEVDEAEAALDEAAAAELGELQLFGPRVDTARLLLDAHRGAVGPDAFVERAARVADNGHLLLAALMLHEAVRIGGADAVAGPLARLAMGTDSALVRVLSRSAAARARADGPALDEVATELEAMGALLFAAEAALAAADAHAAAGASVARVASARRGAALLARCRGAAPPWLAPPTADEPLSDRQREVAVLAAAGMTSREIAERLFLSVRTVDNHLYRIYAKLGVESREELAVALEVDGAASDQR